MEFELTYFEIVVQHINHYATRTPLCLTLLLLWNYFIDYNHLFIITHYSWESPYDLMDSMIIVIEFLAIGKLLENKGRRMKML